MNKIAAFIALMFVSATIYHMYLPKSYLAEKIRETSVTLRLDDGTCAGALISPNEILTAAHCTNFGEIKKFKAEIQGKIFPAVLKRVGKNTDIALLEIPGVQFKKFGTIATNPGHLTDNIFCLGDPKGEMPNSVTHGVISHEDRPNGINPKHHNVFQADCTVFFGNSGGAVLNENGEVIGIISYMEIGDEQEGSNYSFITKLEDIKDLLNG